MKNTKVFNSKKLCAMAIILMTAIVILCISCNGIVAQADVAESTTYFEQKEYCDIDIEDDFDDSCVIVVMDKFSSGFNKSHSAKFSNLSFVKAIKDLTFITGKIMDKLYLNKKSFRQIIKIDLKEPSKLNVLNAISQIQVIDGVLWVGANTYDQPSDLPEDTPIATSGTKYQDQWGLHGFFGINAPSAWNYSTGSKKVKVGVIDSGIAEHEDLKDNVVAGWNFINDTNDTNDTNGHGTAVAGIIGATGATENGVIGVNWEVQITPLKVDKYEESDNKVKFDVSAVTNAITWAINNNIDIINYSGGGTTDNMDRKIAINNFTGLFVCSAGNESNDNDVIKHYPSDYSHGQEFSDRVISVGAIISNSNIASFSNYGSKTVSIFAPGDTITTTCPQIDKYPYNISGYTDKFGGTSAAAPFVTGVAALLYTRYESLFHNISDEYIAAQVKSTILNKVIKNTLYEGKCVSGGILNAAKALQYCQYMPTMKGYGYNDGWYYWHGKVDMEIEDPNSFGFDQNDELYINKPTNLKFYMTTLSAFNAVKEITIDMTFVLRNSAGEVVNIGRAQSYNHTVVVGLISNSKYGFCNFTINTGDLTYNEKYTLTWTCKSTRKDKSYTYTRSFSFNYDDIPEPPASCVADNSLITLADGSQVAVQDLTGNEELLVWNMQTGAFDTAPILFIDKEAQREYEVTNLYFSDGTAVKVIDEHGFWDFDLNQYVYLRYDADKYIGHWFNKQTVDEDGNLTYTKVQLTNVKVATEITSAWSPVTYGHLCYYVNGMLSMPGAITGFINIFEVDPQTMKIDEKAYLADIEKYGLFTYEEFAEICPVPETIYEAFGGQYLKVAIGKGLMSIEEIQNLIARYSKFWE